MINAIIIDDELLALQLLEKQLGQVGGINVAGKYTNPMKGIAALTEEIQVVFLDIQMPEINGVELAKKIREKYPDLIVVFTTAYDQFAVKAFEIEALDYLIKPIQVERLEQTINRLYKKLQIDKEEKPTKLRIKMENYLLFEIEPNKFKPLAWRTAKAQELFIYLLENEGKFVEKDLLAEILWADKDLESGVSLLYTTVYNIRKALRPFENHFKILNRSDGYLLELKDVEIDVLTWLNKLQSLTCRDRTSVKECKALLFEYNGTYLSRHDYIWLERKRQYLTNAWLEKANHVVQYYLQQEARMEAIEMLEKMAARFPTEEAIHFDIMKQYEILQDHIAVEKCYRNLIRSLHEELGVKPSKEVTEWYKENIIKKLNITKMIHE